jgi:hypothetical protein
MKIENLEFTDQNNLCYGEIKNDVELCLFFNWEFNTFNYVSNEATIDVYAYDCEQWINGVRSAYIPTVEEMNEVKQAIENVVFQDLNGYGITEFIESQEIEKDFNEY